MKNGGRPATGSIKIVDAKPYVFVTLAGTKRRPRYPLFVPGEDRVALAAHVAAWLAEGKAHTGRTELERRAAATSARVRNENLLPAALGETVSEWLGRFHTHKEARGLSSVAEMKGRAKNWIAPTIGNLAIAAVTRADVERVVAKLDAAIDAYTKGGRGEGRLSPSSAANVWGDLSHAFDEACNAKDPALRVLTVNPAQGVRGPESGIEREGPILYSDEVVRLLGGVSTKERRPDVPLYRRHVYAMAIYTMARRSELGALTAADVDLVHHTITISKQLDRKSGKKKTTKQTKTRRTRTVDIEAALLPLVELLVKSPEGTEGRLLRMPPPEDSAELLRHDLATVGVDRPELTANDATRTPIWFHHLRDTGLVHMAVRGDSPTVMQWRAGHTDYKTTQGYLDRGRVEARRIGAPLPPLPRSILVSAPRKVSRTVSSFAYSASALTRGNKRTGVTPTGIEPVLPT